MLSPLIMAPPALAGVLRQRDRLPKDLNLSRRNRGTGRCKDVWHYRRASACRQRNWRVHRTRSASHRADALCTQLGDGIGIENPQLSSRRRHLASYGKLAIPCPRCRSQRTLFSSNTLTAVVDASGINSTISAFCGSEGRSVSSMLSSPAPPYVKEDKAGAEKDQA